MRCTVTAVALVASGTFVFAGCGDNDNTKTVTATTATAMPPSTPSTASSAATPVGAHSIDITCTTPKGQRSHRQLTDEDCLNSVNDRTQTFTATVRDKGGRPAVGVHVEFTEDGSDAHFRARTHRCVTSSTGQCSSELVEMSPADGEVIHTTAVIATTGTKDVGSVRFTTKF
jgi:hypothetical protein